MPVLMPKITVRKATEYEWWVVHPDTFPERFVTGESAVRRAVQMATKEERRNRVHG